MPLKLKEYIKRRKWDILIVLIVGIILFVPKARMFVQSNLQRLIATSPDFITKKEQKPIHLSNWSLMDLQGNKHLFLKDKGKIRIINFWATWCPPCIAELPVLENLYKKYGDEVSFYFISREKPEKLKSFLEKKGYSIPVYIPLSKTPEVFKSKQIPTTFVLDKNNYIIVKEVGAKDWFSNDFQVRLNNLLKK